MRRNGRPLFGIVIWGITSMSCREAPPDGTVTSQVDPVPSTESSTLPLRDIMRGLENDLTGVGHGIWIGDHDAVRTAASRIAEHPGVTSDQMSAIQAALGSEFSIFVQHDRAVHDEAVALAEGVDSSWAPAQLFGSYVRLQEGCMSCHTVFQARVAEALANPGGGA